MSFSSDLSLTRIHTQRRRRPDMMGSHADNPGTNTDIIHVDTSPHGQEIANPSADILIGHGSHAEPALPREDIGSHPRPRGRSPSISKISINRGRKPSFLGRTPPCTVINHQCRWLIADWFEVHSTVLGG